MEEMIVIELAHRITIDLRYEEFSMGDIESAELNSSALTVKLKSGEEHVFRISRMVPVFDDHINDITDGLGEPLPFTVD